MRKLIVAQPGQSLQLELDNHPNADNQLSYMLDPMGEIETVFASTKSAWKVFPPHVRFIQGIQFSQVRNSMLSNGLWQNAAEKLLAMSSGDGKFQARYADLQIITTPFWNEILVGAIRSQTPVRDNAFCFSALPVHSLAVDLWRKNVMASRGMTTFSIYVIPITSDGCVPIGHRWGSAARPGMFMTVSAGSFDWDARDPGSELFRELGVMGEDFRYPITFFAVTEYTAESLLNLWYTVELKLSNAQLEHRWATYAPDKYEHERLTFVSLKGLNDYLKTNDQRKEGRLVNVGAGGLWCLLEYLGFSQHPDANPF